MPHGVGPAQPQTAVLRSEVHHEDGRLLVTAIGSDTIFPARRQGSDPVRTRAGGR